MGIVCGEQGCRVKIVSQDHSPGQEFLAVTEGTGDPRFPPFDPAESPEGSESRGARRLALVVEDNRADVFLVERAVEFHQVPVRMIVVEDGEQALKYLESVEGGRAPCPDLVLLDLNLPKRTGSDVLREWRSADRCGNVPIIVFTSSDSAEDRRMAAKLGVTRYFRKPMKYEEFLKIGEVMNEVLVGRGGSA